MRLRQSVPAEEAEDHCLDHQCPCDPGFHVVAAPLVRPTVTLTHQPLTVRKARS